MSNTAIVRVAVVLLLLAACSVAASCAKPTGQAPTPTHTEPTPTPTYTPVGTPDLTPAHTPTPGPLATPTSTLSPTLSPSPTPTVTSTATPSPTPAVTSTATPSPTLAPSSEWSVAVSAEAASEGSNPNLTFGVKSGASDGFDSGIDLPHPPPWPNMTFNAYFSIDSSLFPLLDRDYRAPLLVPGDVREWVIELHSVQNNIELIWDSQSIPSDLHAYVMTGNSSIDLMRQRSIVVPSGDSSVVITVVR